jgi:hypothetical protein
VKRTALSKAVETRLQARYNKTPVGYISKKFKHSAYTLGRPLDQQTDQKDNIRNYQTRKHNTGNSALVMPSTSSLSNGKVSNSQPQKKKKTFPPSPLASISKWKCKICGKQNSFSRMRCDVCGRKRGSHLRHLGLNGIKTVYENTVTEGVSGAGDNKESAPKSKKDTRSSLYFKSKKDYDFDARSKLTNDMAKLLVSIQHTIGPENIDKHIMHS